MLYPVDMDIETRRTIFQRKLVCWYLLCAANTYAARSERVIENRVSTDAGSVYGRESYTLLQGSMQRSLGCK